MVSDIAGSKLKNFHYTLDERGFTMIELIMTSAIVAVLAAIAYTGFVIYKDEAEYSKAEHDLRNALTAIEVEDQESASGAVIGPAISGLSGGAVTGTLANILPGMATSKNIKLMAFYSNCDGKGALSLKHFIVSISCKAQRYVSQTSFCGGTSVRSENLSAGC